MISTAVRILSSRVVLACAAILTLNACQRGDERGDERAAPAAELDWARAALERNPQIELLASDRESGVFTVRSKTTGEIQAVKLSDLAAVPVSQLESSSAAPAGAEAGYAPAQPVAAPRPERSTPKPAPAPDSADRMAATRAEPRTASDSPDYTFQRTDGQVRVSGPGISIVSSDTPARATGQPDAGQRTSEPIICEGRRMIHFDNRNIYVDGDAITARDGCEMYITNSRITASGTGIVVNDAAVYVSNSHIEGANGAFDAADRARIFLRSSTFDGVPRRTKLAMVEDQGGNEWR